MAKLDFDFILDAVCWNFAATEFPSPLRAEQSAAHSRAPAGLEPIPALYARYGSNLAIRNCFFGYLLGDRVVHLIPAQGAQIGRRCLVLAKSFSVQNPESGEWTDFASRSGQPLLMGATWQFDPNSGVERFAVLTTVAGPDVLPFGRHQPVLVPYEHLAKFALPPIPTGWLQQPSAAGLLMPIPSTSRERRELTFKTNPDGDPMYTAMRNSRALR